MRTLNKHQIEHIFEQLKLELKEESKIIYLLTEISPRQHELDSMIWRYRLSGFILALYSGSKISYQLNHEIQ